MHSALMHHGRKGMGVWAAGGRWGSDRSGLFDVCSSNWQTQQAHLLTVIGFVMAVIFLIFLSKKNPQLCSKEYKQKNKNSIVNIW